MAGTSEQVAGWLSRVVELHDRIIERYGGAPGILDASMLQAAIERPWTGLADGTQHYLGVFDKAAALLERIINYHPFVDGNKRTATILVFQFLREHGYMPEVESSEIVDVAVRIADKEMRQREIADWLERITTVRVRSFDKPSPCPWCNSTEVGKQTTSFGTGVGAVGSGGERPKVYRSDYWICAGCGVTFMMGDRVLLVDGELFLLHEPHFYADQLIGLVAAGPWAAEDGSVPKGRGQVQVTKGDVSKLVADHPSLYIMQVVAAIRAKRGS